MAYCSKCGNETPDESHRCVHCGSTVKSKKKIWVGILVALVSIIILVSIISSNGNETSKNSTNNTTNESTQIATTNEKLQISNVEMVVEYNSVMEGWRVIITGKAKNTTSRNFSYADVEFSVYDENGNNLGSAMDNMNNLASGETWSFEATWFEYSKEKPVSCKLADITTW